MNEINFFLYFNNELFLFFIFFISISNSALTVILTKNTVLSIFSLILFFLNLSALLLLFELDFLALIFIIIYVGAIAVLFLFIIMLLNLKINYYTLNLWRELYFGFFLLIPAICLIIIIMSYSFDFLLLKQISYKFTLLTDTTLNHKFEIINYIKKISLFSNIESFGILLYTYHFLLFLIASFVLLVSLIGAIILSLNYNIYIKYQTFLTQINQQAIYN